MRMDMSICLFVKKKVIQAFNTLNSGANIFVQSKGVLTCVLICYNLENTKLQIALISFCKKSFLLCFFQKH